MASPPEFLDISYSEGDTGNNSTIEYPRMLPFANSDLFFGKILNARILASGEDIKTVYEISIDLKGINYNFLPGDTIGIFPQNSEEEVEALLLRLNILEFADKTCTLMIKPNSRKKNASIPTHLIQNTSLRQLFLNQLDIQSIPKKLFLRTLADYTTDKNEVEKLHFMCTATGSTEYNNFINGPGRSLLELLETFSTCQPPVTRILEHLPVLRPRPYSISSSPFLDNEQLKFAVSVLPGKQKGVCSGWLERNILASTSTRHDDLTTKFKQLNMQQLHKCLIPFYFRKSNSFRLPDSLEKPIIMVAAGTGVAPFIGFLQHRHCEKLKGHNLGEAWLFFGCRYSDRDFIYKEELNQFLNDGVLTKLIPSFSRECKEKIYVQHNISKYAEDIMNLLLNKGATFFVCGEVKSMRQDIKNTVLECLSQYNSKSIEDCEEIVLEWQKNNKYVEDIWI